MLNRAACTGVCPASAGIVEGCREECEHLSAPNPGGLTEAQRSLARIAREWHDALGRLKTHIEKR